MGGRPTAEYLASIVLPRPRDILWLINAAIESAVRHRRPRVDESDIVEAEQVYSENAFKALLVEGKSELFRIGEVAYEFAGCEPVLARSEVGEALRRGGISDADSNGALDRLLSLSFLGQEVREELFEHAELPDDRHRIDALARRYAASRSAEPRYSIHPAFRAYLDVMRAPGQQALT